MFNRELETEIKDRADQLFDDVREKMPDAVHISVNLFGVKPGNAGYASVSFGGGNTVTHEMRWDREAPHDDPCD